MIRNLRTLGDDEKQLMLHKEAIQLAIKNDEAIAARAVSSANTDTSVQLLEPALQCSSVGSAGLRPSLQCSSAGQCWPSARTAVPQCWQCWPSARTAVPQCWPVQLDFPENTAVQPVSVSVSVSGQAMA